jgi:hypothetical protein
VVCNELRREAVAVSEPAAIVALNCDAQREAKLI